MSYKNNTIHSPYWHMQLDENVIHINKYRFPDFYYEELDKLNMKYYQHTSTDDTNMQASIPSTRNSKPELGLEFSEKAMAPDWATNNSPVLTVPEEFEPEQLINADQTLPVNIPGRNQNIRRYRLDSLNNFNNSVQQSPPLQPLLQPTMNTSGLDFSISPPLTNSRSSTTSNPPNSFKHSDGIRDNIGHTTHNNANGNTHNSNTNTSSVNESNNSTHTTQTEYYTPSTSHQMIVKRVYDNYLCINIDNVINNITYNPITKQHINHQQLLTGTRAALTTAHDFICDQLAFLTDLRTTDLGSDPFKLFNHSTIGLLFDRMNKSRFPYHLAHVEIGHIIRELNRVLPNGTNGKQGIKQGLLDAAIGIIKNASVDLLQPEMVVANVLVKSLTDFIGWVYQNYTSYWMHESLIQTSLKIATDMGAKFGPQMVTEIYATIKKYFIPSYLFSVSRTAWKFTTIHKREITKLRSLLIPPSYKTQWIIKCVDQSRPEIAWVYPDTPQIRNLVVFIDGRNWFYADEYAKTTGGINLELLRQFMCLPEYQMTLADLVYGRISSQMAAGRQVHNRDPRYVIPVFIFNERHRNQIQPLNPSNRTVIYTPRGQDDDLLTLYLWLSNPGSFIASNDNYGNHSAKLTQHTGSQSTYHAKYYEGLWTEMVRCFKIITTPMSGASQLGKVANRYFNQSGTSAPF